MSLEVLRAAVEKMTAAKKDESRTPGPWTFEPAGDSECGEPGCCTEYWDNRVWGQGSVIVESHAMNDADASHVVSWNPAVTDMVHQWLTRVLGDAERGIGTLIEFNDAVRVASAYLASTPRPARGHRRRGEYGQVPLTQEP